MPDEKKKVGHQGGVQLVLNVDEPAVKAKVGRNGCQLARGLLGCGLALQERLTLGAPLIPLCDQSTKDLHCAVAKEAAYILSSHASLVTQCIMQPQALLQGAASSSLNAQFPCCKACS